MQYLFFFTLIQVCNLFDFEWNPRNSYNYTPEVYHSPSKVTFPIGNQSSNHHFFQAFLLFLCRKSKPLTFIWEKIIRTNRALEQLFGGSAPKFGARKIIQPKRLRPWLICIEKPGKLLHWPVVGQLSVFFSCQKRGQQFVWGWMDGHIFLWKNVEVLDSNRK